MAEERVDGVSREVRYGRRTISNLKMVFSFPSTQGMPSFPSLNVSLLFLQIERR